MSVTTVAPGVLGIHTPLDRMKGTYFLLMGVNRAEKMFRLRDDEGSERWFRVVGTNRLIAAIELVDPATLETIPAGLDREEPLGPVVIFDYNKRNNLLFGETPSAAQWDKGFVLMDVRHGSGHPWLRIGIHNYKGVRPRAVFEYNAIGDEDDGEDEG